jgi:class 3 adenylate cyclase
VATWQKRGLETTVIEPPPSTNRTVEQPVAADASGRVVRAMLFADFKGFSSLADDQVPVFTEVLMGALAKVLDAHDEFVDHRTTAGDGVFAVLRDAPVAARCALAMQRSVAAVDREEIGLPELLRLRLGAHVGPIFQVADPVARGPSFVGSHVSRTARIEPVTPPGTVYVTEPFAAALELAGHERYACDYVGHMPAAKDYGRLRMYRLRDIDAMA